MIVAALLFMIGTLIGWLYTYLAIVAASVSMTLVIVPVWALRNELSWFSILVWFGYLCALQSGYLFGGFLHADDDL